MFSTLFAAARFLTPYALGLTLVAAPAPGLARQTQAPSAPIVQDEQDAVVRVSTELVQTDVMVFDRQGRYVEGLAPEQFELKVDGQTQPIIFFERVEAGTVNEDAQLAAARGGARSSQRAAGPVVPLDRGRTFAFFIDDLHLSAEGALRTRRMLQKFIEGEIGQNDLAAVASASGRIGFLQQYTGHKSVLRAAIERIAAGPPRAHDSETPPMTQAQAVAIERGDPNLLNLFVTAVLRENFGMRPDTAETLVRGRARTLTERVALMAAATLQSLESVVRRSGPLPGRKVLFFISEGFVFDGRDSLVRDRLRRVADAAARAGVVIYALDAQGLRTNAGDASASPLWVVNPIVNLDSSDLSEATAYQAPLHYLAAETGGRALVNTNDLTAGVTGALKETAKYYLLAWKPAPTDEKGGAKFRRIEVTVKGRNDLRVLVRRGFYNMPPEPIPVSKKKGKEKPAEPIPVKAVSPADRDLRTALAAAYPRADLPTVLSLGFSHLPQAGHVLTSSVELGREWLMQLSGAGEERQVFDILGAVFDRDGKTVEVFKQELSFAGRLADAPARTRVIVSHQVPLAPGLYQVRVAARDRRSGLIGNASDWIEIPDLLRQKFALGSVFLAERPAETGTPEAGAASYDSAAQSTIICADCRFARTSWLRFLTHIYSPVSPTSPAPDIALQVQILRDDQPVFTAPLRKISVEWATEFARVPYAAELPLGDFPAGRYALQLTVIDRASKQTSTQRVPFSIE
jgi:VWFA-related protein